MKDFFLIGLQTQGQTVSQAKDWVKKAGRKDIEIHLLPPKEFSTVKKLCTGQLPMVEPEEVESKLADGWIC